ncbi:TonB-dependent receptor domain-containing protein [Caulobacter radicis]|jgi:hemoglobin/transferrin/lactoferrin receptor protein|uniref:TonB-dependent receptor n=1 Tax=Caulobacter radicis TaxID=2172650 RepID=A0A2T9JDT9_9CAUL|nr:TonB-dependent receptor [Caulobacter radicis]PVM81099.1 TonB-dependent receptor [Caulobacter radicis]
MRISNRTRGLLLAGVANLVLAGFAHAQAADAPEEAVTTSKLSLGKVVVSAGQEKVAIDTPQAVTTLDQDAIDQAQASTIGDLLAGIPGVNTMGGVGALGQGFNIRGMGTGLADSDSRILMQIDGVTKFFEQYRMGAFFSDPELYKRVEVLRGPASSTLYGAGALAGVVSFTSKDASDFLQGDDRFAVRLRGGVESNAEARFGSGILAFKPTEKLEVLGMYTSRRSDEYENGNGQVVPASDATSDSYLLKGRYTFGKDHSVWASYQNWKNDSVQIYDQSEAMATTPVRRKTTDDTAVIGYQNAFEGNDLLDFEAQVSYANSKVNQTDTTFLSGVLESEFSYKTLQGRAQNTSEFQFAGDGVAFLTVGAQAYKQERRNPRRTATGVNHGAATHPEGDMEKYGLFAQGEVTYGKLTVIPGVRVDWTKLQPGLGVTTSREIKDNGVSPKIAALYSLTEWASVFGSIAHTVRMPVLDEIYSRTSATASNYSLNLKPEESDNYEVGGTLQFRNLFGQGDQARIKTTLFRNDVSNLIARGTATSSYFVNIGEARYSGVEVEAEYGAKQLFVRGAVSVIDGENRTSGAPLNTIPADTLNLTVGYVFPSHNLTAGWRGEFADDQNETTTASLRTPGYSVHNLFLTWKPQDGALKGLEVQAGVDNLFDKNFRRHLSSLDAEGRTVKLTLGKTF